MCSFPCNRSHNKIIAILIKFTIQSKVRFGWILRFQLTLIKSTLNNFKVKFIFRLFIGFTIFNINPMTC